MKPFMKKLGIFLLVLVVAVISVVYLVFKSPVFENARKAFFERQLAELLGQEVRVDGGVTFSVRQPGIVHITNLLMPGGLEGVQTLAELDRMSLRLDLHLLFGGAVEFRDIRARGLVVNLYTAPDGRSTWQTASPALSPQRFVDHEIVEFLLKRNVVFENFTLYVQSEQSGLEFNGFLDSLSIAYLPEQDLSTVLGSGQLNTLPFKLEGRYPGDTGFASLTFGDIVVEFDSALLPDGSPGYSGTISIVAKSLHDAFDLLQLSSLTQGSAALSARILRTPDRLSLTEISAEMATEIGHTASLTGEIADLLSMSGVALDLAATFEGFDFQLPFDARRQDVSVRSLETHIRGGAEALELVDIHFDLSASEREIGKIGPFSVGRVFRTNDNLLSLSDIRLLIRSSMGSSATFAGDIRDLLSFKSYRFTGTGEYSIQEFLSKAFDVASPDVGGVQFDFRIDDTAGKPGLEYLTLVSGDGMPVDLSATVSVDDIKEFDGVQYELEADVRDPEAFNEGFALSLPQGFELQFGSRGRIGLQTAALDSSVRFGRSELQADLNVTAAPTGSEVLGRVSGPLVALQDVEVLAVSVQTLVDNWVGGKTQQSDPTSVRPLVVAPGETRLEVPGTSAVKPLVLSNGGDEPASWTQRFEDAAQALKLGVSLDVEAIRGLPGVTALKSNLKLEKGTLSLSPITVRFGDTSGNIGLVSNLLKDPGRFRLSGNLNHLPLATVLDQTGLDIPAEGTFGVQFDLNGTYALMSRFLETAAGQINFRLMNGRIGSSILDLAGIGLLPWLFSTELAQGYSEVTCIVAPLRISNGRVTTKASVFETRSVQLVLQGHADLKTNTLDVLGEPRPIGAPLAPSHYPFRVSGPLANPNVEILDGVRRTQGNVEKGARVPCIPDARQSGGR